MSRLIYFASARTAYATLMAVLLLAASHALLAVQPERKTPPRTPRAADSTLFLMVRAGSELNDDLLRETLELGLEKADCQYEKPIDVQSIPASVFEELAKLIGQGGLATPPAAASEDINVRQLPTRGSTWEFRLSKPTQMLQELTIRYRKGGEQKYTAKASEENKRLTLIVPGSYAVQLLPNDDPISYEAKLAELGQKPQVLKKKWIPIDRFFAITIRKFQGEQDKLFSVLQDKEKIANPLKNIEPIQNFTFAFANLKAGAGKLGERIMEGNVYLPQVPGVEERNPKRVWIYFPLTKEEAIKARDEYRKKGTVSLPKAIRDSGKTVTADNKDMVVDAKSVPRWFELLDRGDGRGFTRQIPLADFRQLQVKYPQVWRLVVWEFDSGDTPQAIRVQHPADKELVYVLEEEIKGLPSQIAERGKKENKAEPKKP